MLPFTAGARPGKMNMISLPNSANSRLLPERKPSPTPTRSSKEPTPQAIPNMVRNERSLCAQRLRKICAKMSDTVRIVEIVPSRYERCRYRKLTPCCDQKHVLDSHFRLIDARVVAWTGPRLAPKERARTWGTEQNNYFCAECLAALCFFAASNLSMIMYRTMPT
jgi:hypothetical protein